MKSVSRGLCMVAAINLTRATLCALAASHLGALVEMEPIPAIADSGAASAPRTQSDRWQHPALQAALDDSRAHDLALPLLEAHGGSDTTAAEFISNVERRL
ncbi:MAG: hypothetical protein WCF44_03105 [Candidatus Methylophosphatis roskildensis]